MNDHGLATAENKRYMKVISFATFYYRAAVIMPIKNIISVPEFETARVLSGDSFIPLVCGIDFRLLSVNRALISPILVLWVALLPSVSSTRHSHHPLPLQAFTLSFEAYNFPFLQILPTVAFFFSSGLTPRIPLTVYRYFWAYTFFTRYFFPPLFSCWFRAVD